MRGEQNDMVEKMGDMAFERKFGDNYDYFKHNFYDYNKEKVAAMFESGIVKAGGATGGLAALEEAAGLKEDGTKKADLSFLKELNLFKTKPEGRSAAQ